MGAWGEVVSCSSSRQDLLGVLSFSLVPLSAAFRVGKLTASGTGWVTGAGSSLEGWD